MELSERLEKLEDIIRDPVFRQNKGLGNEVNYRIFDYPPKHELEVRRHVRYLKDKINRSELGYHITEFDLWDTMVALLKAEEYYDAFLELEEEHDFQYIAESLVETLGLSETDERNLIVSHIIEHTDLDSVIFLTGVGKCFRERQRGIPAQMKKLVLPKDSRDFVLSMKDVADINPYLLQYRICYENQDEKRCNKEPFISLIMYSIKQKKIHGDEFCKGGGGD